MTDATVTNPLPPLYYLDNFYSILDTVSSRYPDLLTRTESEWIAAFKALAQPAQLLLVRMLSRKGNWFREDKFNYPEIPSIDAAINELATSSLVSVTSSPTLDVALAIHTKPELLQLFDSLPLKASAKKPEIVDEIMRHAGSCPVLPYRCIEVSHDVLPVFLLLYFGNSRQNLSEFVVSDLGIYHYETVPLNIKDRLFNERSQIDAWLALSNLADEYWETVESKQRAKVRELVCRLPEPFDWPPLAYKRNRLVNAVARDLERLGDIDAAEFLFVTSALPPAKERLARMALSQNDVEKAAGYVADMLASPYNEEEKEIAERLARQLSKKGAIDAPAKTKNVFEEECVALTLTQRVEMISADYYREQGWQVWYCENLVLNALFGLAFWDIIFSPISGAFLNPFQRSPKDMYLPEFIESREDVIQSRLADIRENTAFVLDTYEQKYGLANDWVYWDYVDKTLISAALNTLSNDQLIACFERILFDRKNNRSGHPDLFMTKDGKCRFVEIKGPGDKLQHHQIRWLNFFVEQGIDARVLYVSQPQD
ncbi:VRR-NUC domain-containing protein [Enterovibrio coralii]|uniref:phosphodiesterase I n=1 Tax=Enterovibrio coralii TaxID=294935 RepID=A0A135I8M5_9GAMM|nr:VRR-NUC domain-containing protein [Enterovibrio coralii]KXF81734.1 restriction endonuclease [Enterovibrio coralii]